MSTRKYLDIASSSSSIHRIPLHLCTLYLTLASTTPLSSSSYKALRTVTMHIRASLIIVIAARVDTQPILSFFFLVDIPLFYVLFSPSLSSLHLRRTALTDTVIYALLLHCMDIGDDEDGLAWLARSSTSCKPLSYDQQKTIT